MKLEVAAYYKDRFQSVWRNVQANRQLRPADIVNGYRMVQPLRSLSVPGCPFDMAQLVVEMFARLQVRYHPADATSIASRIDVPAATSAAGLRVGLFVDSPDHMSGVAMTLSEWREQARLHDRSLTLHTCATTPATGFVSFAPMGSVGLEIYRGLTVQIPRMDDIMAYMDRMAFDVIHVSTPGPMGLLGLLAARQRGIPVCGTYHTDFPRYARELTGDPGIEEVGWRFMRWFYGQLDRVAAPTDSVRRDLVSQGLDARRIRVVGRGVDTAKFSPLRRDAAWRREWGGQHSLILLYAGRISREKNLDTLAGAFRKLRETRPDVCLVLAGDGPFRAELEMMVRDLPVRFAGMLDGAALARAYASSDLFVFPSRTDTFGRVVLEAQASGLPVVVSGDGGPKHAMIDGQTGIVVDPIVEDNLVAAIDTLTNDPARMSRFSRAACAHAATCSHQASFDAFWNLHRFEPGAYDTTNREVMP
jgi:glycosyltransferase involved in cell wall biosynthesis